MNISHLPGIKNTAFVTNERTYSNYKPNTSPYFSSTDTINISSEAMEKYLASKNDSQSTVATTVSNWYNNEFRNGVHTSYSDWLPENYAKFKEMTGEASIESTYSCKLSMVFDALGADKIITEQDIAEGVAAVEKEMMNLKLTTTIEDLNARLKPVPGADIIAQGQKDIIEAERKLDAWLKEKAREELNKSQNSTSTGVNSARPSNISSKSMYSMLLESLFMAELEESGAIGNGNGTEQAARERHSNEAEIDTSQPNKVKSVNPLKDGDNVAQIKKVLLDLAKGKADLADISTAIGGGDKGGKVEAGKADNKGNDNKSNDEKNKIV